MPSPSSEEILLKLIQGDEGAKWATIHRGWKVPADAATALPVCDWDYVECDKTNTRITSIKATDSDLIASIPPEFGMLTYLERIVFDYSEGRENYGGIMGTIPQEFAKLENLIEVNFATNTLTGSIPTFVSSKLQTLNLTNNQLYGTLPAEFYYGKKSHESLLTLDLSLNQLFGTLSDAIGTLQKLETLSLSDNAFSGTLPGSIGLLQDLRYVYLSNNHFQGTFPTDFVNPDASLKEVWVQSNLLSGTLPIAFGQMDKLRNLYIDGNKFTGSVPKELCTDVLNTDFVQEDLIDPVTGQNVSTCVRLACPIGQYSAEGLWPCNDCPDGQKTPYLGTEESCYPTDQKAILAQVYEMTTGSAWTLPTNNWNDESIDECQYTGIECNNNGHITKISLPGAGLGGAFPNVVGFLEHLNHLDLSDNSLTGFLSVDLSQADIDHFDISGNKIRGVIPPWLCLQGGMNENGDNGHYHCTLVACPSGTYSSIGRESLKDNIKCKPCKSGYGLYIGSKSCSETTEDLLIGDSYYAEETDTSGSLTYSTPRQNNAGRTGGIIILVLALVGLMFFVFFVIVKQVKRRKEEEHEALNSIKSMRSASGSTWSLTNRDVI